MSRIPLGGEGTVFDNLTQSTRIEVAREGAPGVIAPAQFPRSAQESKLALEFAWAYGTQLRIPVGDQIHFAELLAKLLSACERRRFGEYENESWWSFSGAEARSKEYGTYMADGLTRTLVAARAREMSARTGGYILLQLLQDLAQPGMQVDRVLNAPTNVAWIEPWLEYLEGKGVDYRFCHRVEAIRSDGGRVTGVAGHEVTWPEQTPTKPFEETADLYIAAVPVEVMQNAIDIPLKASVPELGKLDQLKYRWMNGIVFYLRRDVPLVHGHTIFINSAWSLTAISQQQFWRGYDVSKLGDGSVKGILSVDISEWETPGNYTARGKPAMDCSKDEIASEVWAQLKASLNGSREVLSDANLVGWFLDPDIVAPNPKGADTNLEPLLVNVEGSWTNRPDAGLPAVPNLFLAADYVRTYTDLATMEGANEAARRAVNAILDATNSTAKRCQVWKLHELGGPFALARAADNLLYR
ncbi:MAG: FAD-dependent oxidoreductase [Solirubrobacterales bacterium]|nr:FAD-dependent oxidoreductase [Solirubrobacterales bacterium]